MLTPGGPIQAMGMVLPELGQMLQIWSPVGYDWKVAVEWERRHNELLGQNLIFEWRRIWRPRTAAEIKSDTASES